MGRAQGPRQPYIHVTRLISPKAHAHVVAKRTTGPGIVHSKESICNYCQKIGHLQSVCLQKRKDSHTVTVITKRKLWSVKRSPSTPARLVRVSFEVDTGAGDNFCSMDVWMKLGKPALTPTTSRYEVANGQLFLPWERLRWQFPFSRKVLLPGRKASPSLSPRSQDLIFWGVTL